VARRPNKRYSEEDFDSLEGRASKTEQKKAVQRMAALGEQLAELSAKQIQKLPVDERLIDALLDVKRLLHLKHVVVNSSVWVSCYAMKMKRSFCPI
jgi:ribosome-associated protein